MPHCSKASTAAHTKWKQSNSQFTWTSPKISDTGSLYNDPGDENSSDESSVLDEFDGIDSNDDDTAESLESLQKLYMVFLHSNKQKKVQKRIVSNKSHREFTFTHWQLNSEIMQVDPIWSKEGYNIYWRLTHQWHGRKGKAGAKPQKGARAWQHFFRWVRWPLLKNKQHNSCSKAKMHK